MRKKGAKAKPYGNPNQKNIRRGSNPKTPAEQKQAIADDIEAEIRGYLPVIEMEGALMRRNLRQVLGIGGPDLKQWEQEFESDFEKSSVKDKKEAPPVKQELPDLKRVSIDTTVKINVPKPSKSSGVPNKPKSSNKPPKK